MEVEGQPIGLYLRNDRLTVISSTWGNGYPGPMWGGLAIDIAMPWGGYASTPPQVIVTVLDVTDRAAPQVVQTSRLDGSYLDSRAIGDTAYVITSDEFGLPAPELKCEEKPNGDPSETQPDVPGFARPSDLRLLPLDGSQCVYETRDEYTQRISGKVFDLALPHYSAEDGTEQEVEAGLLSLPGDIYKPISKDYWNLITVSVFDMAGSDAGPSSSTSVPTNGATTIYASALNLYLTNPNWGSGWGGDEATSILKFALGDVGQAVDLVAVGKVPGRALNSFSLDEYATQQGQEYLRIATTRGWGPDSDNRVFVLAQDADEMVTVGQTERLAPGEQIFSVRYLDTTAYVVTFRQVDPLFAIDLTDPAAPVVKGELKIPGFSNYLQSVGDDFLIGLGRDADPVTGRVEGLQLSLFDVSDLAAPELAARFEFDLPGWAWTEAIDDHHAISYFPEYQVLTVPVSNDGWIWMDRTSDGINDVQTWRPRTDLYVFGVELPTAESPATKPALTLLGTIEDDAQIRRSVRIEQFLYSISNNSVTVHQIRDPKAQVAELHFGQEDVGVPVFAADRNLELVQFALQTPEQAAPQVVDVLVGNSQWDKQFVNYLQEQRATATARQMLDRLPFAGIDQIKVTFSEDVIVGYEDLTVTGGDGVQNTIREFTYDIDTRTAVWTLTKPLGSSSVTVRLGSVVDLNGTALDGDADGRAGGRFRSEYHLLPGDVDQDGRVDLADVASAKAHQSSDLSDAGYSLSHDVNGDGQINESDLVLIMANLGATLPSFEPPITGDADGNGRFDSQDLVQVMQGGKYRTGQYARWDEGDWNRDGLFDESDFVTAFQQAQYQLDSPAAVSAIGLAIEELAAATERRLSPRR
jgi:hypothetical protein